MKEVKSEIGKRLSRYPDVQVVTETTPFSPKAFELLRRAFMSGVSEAADKISKSIKRMCSLMFTSGLQKELCSENSRKYLYSRMPPPGLWVP